MKIYIIRHATVDMKWPKKCCSTEFDEACRKYDASDILSIGAEQFNMEDVTIYISDLYRSRKTAEVLYPDCEYVEADIGEVPLRSFMDTRVCLPLWMWNVIGRLQWFVNNPRQRETRKDTVKRCNRVISELMEEEKTSVLVTHGFFMRTFIKCLRKQGYRVSGKSIFFSNLQMVTVEK